MQSLPSPSPSRTNLWFDKVRSSQHESARQIAGSVLTVVVLRRVSGLHYSHRCKLRQVCHDREQLGVHR